MIVAEPFHPKMDFSVQIRGGYQDGSRGRRIRKGDNWHCKCVNCGEEFANRVLLRKHYFKCQYFYDIDKANTNEVVIEQEDSGVIVIDDSDVENDKPDTSPKCTDGNMRVHQEKLKEIRDKRSVIEGNIDGATACTSKTVERRNGADVVNGLATVMNNDVRSHRSGTRIDNDNIAEVNNNISESRAQQLSITSSVLESVRQKTELFILQQTYNRKRYSENCDFNSLENLRKRRKATEDSDSQGIKSLVLNDAMQEKLHNAFYRTQQSPYQCPICKINFRYRSRYDYHLKYAHIPVQYSDSSLKRDTNSNASEVSSVDSSLSVSVVGNRGLDTEKHSDREQPSSEKLLKPASTSSELKTPIDLSHNALSDTKPQGCPRAPQPLDNEDKLETLATIEKESVAIIAESDKMQEPKRYRCNHCYLSFRYLTRLVRHEKECHLNKESNAGFSHVFKCNQCDLRLADNLELMKHYSSHLRQNSPEKCVAEVPDSLQETSIFTNATKYQLLVGDILQHLRSNLICLKADKELNLPPEENTDNHLKLKLKIADETEELDNDNLPPEENTDNHMKLKVKIVDNTGELDKDTQTPEENTDNHLKLKLKIADETGELDNDNLPPEENTDNHMKLKVKIVDNTGELDNDTQLPEENTDNHLKLKVKAVDDTGEFDNDIAEDKTNVTDGASTVTNGIIEKSDSRMVIERSSRENDKSNNFLPTNEDGIDLPIDLTVKSKTKLNGLVSSRRVQICDGEKMIGFENHKVNVKVPDVNDYIITEPDRRYERMDRHMSAADKQLAFEYYLNFLSEYQRNKCS